MRSCDLTKERLLEAIGALDVGQIKLMEVCGTHTMAIAKAGIRSLLPESISLLSGPGCPVCVTPAEVIDKVLELSMQPGIVIATYGDMVRVPGSVPGDSLMRRRALGARVEIVYSPVDAVSYAAKNPDIQVVFLGVGFETTAPGTAAAIKLAEERGAKNFCVWSMLKTVEPALRALTCMEGFDVQGFICPGHVATVIGETGFEFLPRDYSLPGVISGFEPEDILLSVYLLSKQISDGRAEIENQYKRAVHKNGNPLALEMMKEVFTPRYDIWRGLGGIEGSGLEIKDRYAAFDAEKRFGIVPPADIPPVKTACRCGDVITGRISPRECPLFSKRCVPEDPVGPCMVSSEGACAAYYKYSEVI